MSTNGRGVSDGTAAPAARANAAGNGGFGSRDSGGQGGAGGAAGLRKKRRRQRGQRNKRRGPQSMSPHGDHANRERVYQDIEGLLRQIREIAEESAVIAPEHLDELAHAVVTLFKALEGEGPMISDRLFGEYQRVREKLNHALRDHVEPEEDSRQ